MAENSKIEWTDHTGNLWWGCTNVHAGCDNCYAETWSNRFNNNLWGNDAPRKLVKSVWGKFAKWQRDAAAANEKHVVFVGSMMDIFEKPLRVIDNDEKETGQTTGDLRNRFFNQVVPASPNLIFLLLTKRPSNINRMVPAEWLENPPANVMYGASVVDQKSADDVARHLSKVKGPKFLSVEPLLEDVNMKPFILHYYNDDDRTEPPVNEWSMTVDWVIVGGESGDGRRPFDPDWARHIRHDCEATGTPFFMKQMDKKKAIPADLMIRQFPPMIPSV